MFVHHGLHQVDAPAAGAQFVGRARRLLIRIERRAVVANFDLDSVFRFPAVHGEFLARISFVGVLNDVRRRFADRENDLASGGGVASDHLDVFRDEPANQAQTPGIAGNHNLNFERHPGVRRRKDVLRRVFQRHYINITRAAGLPRYALRSGRRPGRGGFRGGRRLIR